eukprot:a842295_38.p1 GENE.a842295_38~~a842295_38.p1  ORF type:complete len:122 (+),score=3.61 a842295_38:48-368(+)
MALSSDPWSNDTGPNALRPQFESSPAVLAFQGFLGRSVRIEVSDARVLRGVFRCVDHEGNMVVSQCHEFRKVPDAPVETRFFNLVIVPGVHIRKLEVEMPAGSGES